MVVGLGIVLVLTFFVLLPMRIKQRHDYWCHRSRIPVGEDHGNQEPHVLQKGIHMSSLSKIIKEVNELNGFRKISKRNMMMIEALNVYKYIDAQLAYHDVFPTGSARKVYKRKHLLCDAVDELKSRGFRRPTHLQFLAKTYLQIKGIST